MFSFHVKFVQTDSQTNRRTTVKQYAPDLSIQGYKNSHYFCKYVPAFNYSKAVILPPLKTLLASSGGNLYNPFNH